MQGFPILSFIVFTPLIGTLLILLIPKTEKQSIKTIALFAAAITLLLSLMLYFQFDKSNPKIQFIEKSPFSVGLGIEYHLGVDGISLPMILLTALLTLLAIGASWNLENRPKGFFAFLLLLETGMLGVFASLDLVLFYVFWEMGLVPMYFLISIWGYERREYAAIKFFIYTLTGSVVMLLGILALYFYSSPNTFNIATLTKSHFPPLFQEIVFIALSFGFAIKVPLFPFHTWLPDAHVEAPTAGSVLLAGILLKMGAYGFMRISLPILPHAFYKFAPLIAIPALINIVYGAFVAMAQTDLKKMVAYSSVSHMGFVMLGMAALTSAGINGAVLQMFNHGVITGMLFLLVGLIYERTHTREIPKMGGLFSKVPILAGIISFGAFASMGLPGLSGFTGEFLCMIGSFTGELPMYKVITSIATIGLVITATYFLRMLQRVVLGVLPSSLEKMVDLNGREVAYLVPLIFLIIVIGAYPATIINLINPASSMWLNIMKTRVLGG